MYGASAPRLLRHPPATLTKPAQIPVSLVSQWPQTRTSVTDIKVVAGGWSGTAKV